MENTEVEKSVSSEDTIQLNRNRSFKSKQLVRSQAIRESQSPPRALSPAQRNTPTVSVSPASAGISAPSVGNSAPSVDESAPSVNNSAPSTENDDARTVSVSDDSSHVSVRCSDGVSSSDVKISDSDDYKKKPVEIQITSGGWEDPQCNQRHPRRWASDTPRDLLSNNPRVACVCGTCAACPHCRGRRRRHFCATKQDSGIVCSDDCPDCSDNETGGSNNDMMRKSNSLDVDDQTYYCRCPERKERPKNMTLSRNDSDDRNELTGSALVAFIKETLNKNVRDRMALLKIEKELHALVNDTGRCIVRFPVMTSYGRMLVHRCASLFQLSHHLDHSNKTSVLVSKSGTSGGRLPCTSFKEWCTATFPPSPQRHQPDSTHAKSILKRDTHSLDEPGTGALASNRSKSLEQREREYERVRRRIFSSDGCTQQDEQWPWLNSGPVKLLTPDGARNKLLKVQSLEGSGAPSSSGSWRGRGAVSKSHSFGGYAAAEPSQPSQPRLLSRQGDLASSSWRLSPSSSGYKTLSLRSTDSITPSPTGGASPEPAIAVSPAVEGAGVVWCVTDMAAVPAGAMVIHPQTGRPLTNPDGSVYHFDPANPPLLYDPGIPPNDAHKNDQNNEKRRGRLEKQHSFIDNDCECQPSEECRSKCCCECRRHEGCQQKTTSEKETNTKAPSASPEARFESTQTNAQESTNQKPAYTAQTNQKTESYEAPPTRPVYEAPKPIETQRSYESTNQRTGNEHNRQKLANQESQEFQYQYAQGYRPEEVTSPQQMLNHYVPEHLQTMPQAKVTPVPIDPNIRPMSLTNMTNVVYPAAVPQGYPYRVEHQPPMHMYQPMVQQEEQKLAPSPHTNETFRIDPSYPYAAVDYTAACGACVDTSSLQHQQRSYSVPYGQVEVPQAVLPPYQVGNMIIPQPHLQPYPYQEPLQWGGVAPTPKLLVPEVYHPIVPYPQPAYPHYNIVYPQVIPQPYPICQPVYPVLEKQPEQRRNSLTANKRNSISSSRNTPSQEDIEKVPYEDKSQIHRQNSEIAARIQQIKSQMAQVTVRDKDKRRDEWRRRNSANGLLGNFPTGSFNGRLVGRSPNDEAHLSSAARAIVNSIRNMQAKNTYQDPRRELGPRLEAHKAERPDARRRERDEHKHEHEQPYLLRQMSPGTWCRRSPGPVHPALNHPRRPHPDARNPRR